MSDYNKEQIDELVRDAKDITEVAGILKKHDIAMTRDILDSFTSKFSASVAGEVNSSDIIQDKKAESSLVFSTEWFDLGALFSFDRTKDPDCLIGRRWLNRGDSFILQGYTGLGKSSLVLQMAMLWALNREFFGIAPKRPLKIILIQAENNKGDIAEPFQDISENIIKLEPGDMDRLKAQLIIGRQSAVSGAIAFSAYVRSLIVEHNPDLVILDPLLSYFGDDISSQKAASVFFRNFLQPIQNETGVIFGFVHHLGKPPKGGDQRQGPALYNGLGSSDIFNWAREVITLTPQSEKVYKLEFGKRGFKAGITDDQGETTSELYLKRADGGKCYWSKSDEIKNSDEAKKAKERDRHAKLRLFIIEKGIVTLQTLKSRANHLEIGVNNIKTSADSIVFDSQNTDQRIYSFVRKIKGASGVKPTIYSTYPEPDGDAPIELPKDYQYEDNGSKKENPHGSV